MALIVCPECGREKVSDQAEQCPDCGFPIKKHIANEKKKATQERIQNLIDEYKDKSKEDLERIVKEKGEKSIEGFTAANLLNMKKKDEKDPLVGNCNKSIKPNEDELYPSYTKKSSDELEMIKYESKEGSRERELALFVLSERDALDAKGVSLAAYSSKSTKELNKIKEVYGKGTPERILAQKVLSERQRKERLKKQVRSDAIAEKKNENKKVDVNKQSKSAVQNEEKKKVLSYQEAKMSWGFKCPNCEKNAGYKIGIVSKGVSVGLLGLASSKIGKTYKCKNCGYIW